MLLERARDRVEDLKLAEGVLEKKEEPPAASLVLARLARLAGDAKQERALLEAAQEGEPAGCENPPGARKIYYDASEFVPAAKVLEQGRKLEPHDTEFWSSWPGLRPDG